MSKKSFSPSIRRDDQIILSELNTDRIISEIGQLNNQSGFYKGVLLDVETTGLDYKISSIIEIALREFYFDSNYRLVGFGRHYNAFSDPRCPVPPEITELTGITDSEVRGQELDWQCINDFCTTSSIIIAHNAQFDRNFLKARREFNSNPILWGCSKSQVPWKTLGFKWRDLEALSVFHGFYYSSHRALIDVDVLGYLLSKNNYLSLLLQEAIRPVVRVKAFKAPFDSKDLLKAKGYSWHPELRCWWKDEPKDQMELIWKWLMSEVYKNGVFNNCQFEEVENHRKFDF
jgi:DNA polymerase-3 subunit epsilon